MNVRLEMKCKNKDIILIKKTQQSQTKLLTDEEIKIPISKNNKQKKRETNNS